jgi:PfaB family protein
MAVRDLIAVVGRAGRFPGSGADLNAFWTHIDAAADCGRPVPDNRWAVPKSAVIRPGGPSPDAVEHDRSYTLDPFEVDLDGLKVDPEFVSRLDPLYQLVLDVGSRAWKSFDASSIDPRRAGLILGNICLPTDKANDLARDELGGKLGDAAGRPRSRTTTEPLNHFVAGLPAGLLAKSLDLGLGSFTLDAACASSLYAIELAAQELLSYRADVMLAGGCSRPDSLYTQMGFSQLRALSPSGLCSPFDAKADGLVVGEGAGIFVLKRLGDAIAHGDRIYAVLHGAGLSNDTAGNLLAPAVEGQLRAMQAAYDSAGWDPSEVELIECHATGTPVGDAIEFEALCRLWSQSTWRPGQCAIGSVKSTVGHLLTGAGAAAVMKVLLAFENEKRPPQANFQAPGDQIRLEKSPFRILTNSENWNLPSSNLSRKAAVSGFGFGGVNAHLLFADRPSHSYIPLSKRSEPVAVAIVGLSAHLGPFETARELQEHALGSPIDRPTRPKTIGWDLAETTSPAGYFLDELSIPLDRYRIPPKELEEMLPQQLAALASAWDAVEDVKRLEMNEGSRTPAPRAADPRSGVILGVSLDPNTTNFHLRWSIKAQTPDLADAASPPLTADRTMGALASCAASRIAKSLQWGGPAFTVCSEESSGARAFELAVRALQRGTLDRVIAGAVDFTGDPRTIAVRNQLDGSPDIIRSDGSVGVVLKRLADAERDGDRVYAVVSGIGTAVGGSAGRPGPDAKTVASAIVRAFADAAAPPTQLDWMDSSTPGHSRSTERDALLAFAGTSGRSDSLYRTRISDSVGDAGAAGSLASIAATAMAVYQEVVPPSESVEPNPHRAGPRYWLSNRSIVRRAGSLSMGVDGTSLVTLLEEHHRNRPQPVETRSRPTVERRQPLGARDEAIFALEHDTPLDLKKLINELSTKSNGHINVERLARSWFSQHRLDPRKRRAVTIVARSIEELREQLNDVRQRCLAEPEIDLAKATLEEVKWRDRLFLSQQPLGRLGKLAFVFPGSGSHFAGMGQSLGVAFPDLLRRQQAENELLREQFAGSKFWRSTIAPETTLAEFLFGQVAVGSLGADWLQSVGIKPDAMIGISLGESAGLFGMRLWRNRDEMLRRIRQSTLFQSDLAPPFDAARQHFGWSGTGPINWTVGVIQAHGDDIRSHLRPGLRAYLLMMTGPGESVIGGLAEDVRKLAELVGGRFVVLDGVTLAHCEAGKPVERPYRDLHLLPITPVAGLKVYSGAWGRTYTPTDMNAADSITTGLLNVIDVPAVINAAYRDGVRLFLEVGPGGSATRSIASILNGKPHLARTISAARQNETSLALRLLAQLISERVPVDLGAVYGRETVCVGHIDRSILNRSAITIPVGLVAAPLPLLMPTGDPDSQILRRGPAASALDLTDYPNPPPGWHAHDSAVGISAVAAAEFPEETEDDNADSIMPSPMPRITRTPAPIVADSPIAIDSPKSSTFVEPIRPSASFTTPPPLRSIAPDVIVAATATQQAGLAAHEAFLTVQSHSTAIQSLLIRQLMGFDNVAADSHLGIATDHVPRSLTTEQCFTFARGRIGDVLGPRYAAIDNHPTRVRLPDDELMLVDRILAIEGEPLSMTRGRVITEHTVRPDRWYLDSGVCPTSITVESGQADLFLSGYLGIDFETKGLAVYRLLDAVVTFHRGLPRVGETIIYDICIDAFFRQADSWLFRFRFEGTIDGRPLLSMQNGVAGFFTAEALAAGQGIIHTKLDLLPMPGKVPAGWKPILPLRTFSLDETAVAALRDGHFVKAFGPEFQRLDVAKPMRLPGGKLRLLDRVPRIDHSGGRFSLGFIRAEYRIDPKDWFLTCHFVDDRVMPGTLMYECCLHTLRTLLASMGWIGEEGKVVCEPVPGINSRLKCRGQVIETTRLVTYEVTIKEIGESPDMFAIADALMYADGKPIVEILNMSLRMTGLTRSQLEESWSSSNTNPPNPTKARYDSASILAFSNGNPSDAFGEPYRIFDQDRVIARLPGPPYQFLDRIVDVTGEPFVLKAGAACVAEYNVPETAWYFEENRLPLMPFSVLLEIALQPCGWLAAYCGSALTSSSDLSFRNLGGKATQFRAVTPKTGKLTIRITMTNVSQSAGMIIQHYSMAVSDSDGRIYEGTTYFGFFGKEALRNQIGMPQAKVPWPSEAETLRAESTRLPDDFPFPGPKLRMVDRIPQFIADGGKAGLGLIVGTIQVDPLFWFFKAHFFQDPVWPGSLGLESFLQLLKYVAWRRWGAVSSHAWQTVALNAPHEWTYRGQVIPDDQTVTVVLEVTAVDDQQGRITADGFLLVDGRIIYQMKDFTLE